MKTTLYLYLGLCTLLIGAGQSSFADEPSADNRGTEAGTAAASPFAQAESAVATAREKELAASEDYDSFQMAHAAAREIARAEQARASEALQKVQATEALIATAVAAKQEEEVTRLRQELLARLATLRAATDQMLIDSRISTKASEEVLVGELDIRTKMTASRDAEQALLLSLIHI